jgi:hypothetical protein
VESHAAAQTLAASARYAATAPTPWRICGARTDVVDPILAICKTPESVFMLVFDDFKKSFQFFV